MNLLNNRVGSFLRSDDGPTTTEYAVVLAMLTIVVLGTLTMLGRHVHEQWSAVGD